MTLSSHGTFLSNSADSEVCQLRTSEILGRLSLPCTRRSNQFSGRFQACVEPSAALLLSLVSETTDDGVSYFCRIISSVNTPARKHIPPANAKPNPVKMQRRQANEPKLVIIPIAAITTPMKPNKTATLLAKWLGRFW